MGHLLEGSEVVVDVKGPGQVVGEVFMQEAPPPCRYSARARGDVLALKLTQENYLRALAAMYYEAEHGARASAHSSGAFRGRPLPAASASSPGLMMSGSGGGGSRGGDAAAAGMPAAAAAAGLPITLSAPAAAAAAGGAGAATAEQQQHGRLLAATSSVLLLRGMSASTASFTSLQGASFTSGHGDREAGQQHAAAAVAAAGASNSGAAAGTAYAAAAAPAGAVTAAGGSSVPAPAPCGVAAMPNSLCGSLGSMRDAAPPQSSCSTAPLSACSTAPLSAATIDHSSSSSLMMQRVGGAGSISHHTGRLAAVTDVDSCLYAANAPLRLIGSGDGTDDEAVAGGDQPPLQPSSHLSGGYSRRAQAGAGVVTGPAAAAAVSAAAPAKTSLAVTP